MAVTSCKIFARPHVRARNSATRREFAIPYAPPPRVFEGNCARAGVGLLIATNLDARAFP